MERENVKRDVVTYNAVLDAVSSEIRLGRLLFEEGVKQGFYARVSRLAKHWFELDLHFLSLGGGEIALGWWFEECLVPYLMNTEKLKDVKSISIVTGYGKTRTRGRRMGDDGMRKRCKAMLEFMGIKVSCVAARRTYAIPPQPLLYFVSQQSVALSSKHRSLSNRILGVSI
jgi:hypothetical protein